MGFFLTMDYAISIWILLGVFFLTLAVAILTVHRIKNGKKKLFFYLIYLSYFVFSGFGISIFPNTTYFIYYSIYLIAFSIFAVYTQNQHIKFRVSNEQIDNYINNKGDYIIAIYIFFMCSSIIYPEIKIDKLWNPPVIDNSNIERFTSYEGVDLFSKIKTLVLNFITPLFYICIIKYIKKPIKLLMLLVLPIYVSYCSSGYVGRSIIVLIFLYYTLVMYTYYPQKRKLILITSASFLILLIPAFTILFFIRNGGSFDGSQVMDFIDPIIRIECTYNYWFDDVYKYATAGHSYVSDYIIYMIFQPIPGIFKQWIIGNFQVNYSIATMLTGVSVDEESFFVPLTGLVAESVFIFGESFFFIHAFILAYIMNIFLNFTLSKKSFNMLYIYAVIFTALITCRAGTTAGNIYPYIIKTLVYVPLFFYVVSKKSKIAK